LSQGTLTLSMFIRRYPCSRPIRSRHVGRGQEQRRQPVCVDEPERADPDNAVQVRKRRCRPQPEGDEEVRVR